MTRLLVTREEAAESLGVSLRSFQRHVQPFLYPVYVGRSVRFRTEDVAQWVHKSVHGS